MFTRQRAFTIIELLVVMGIIGLLASVVVASIAPAREKARDARRLQDMNTIRSALELYYEANKQYPAFRARTGASSCGTNWCALETALAPFVTTLPRDPSGLQTTYLYYYDSNTNDGYQTYGLMMRPENSMNVTKAGDDGGFYSNFQEIGTQPVYCMNKYGGNWWPSTGVSPTASVCAGGD